MDYVSANDIYEIRLASIITNVDKDVLVELYQPLVGADAIMLYLTLQKQFKNGDKGETFKIKNLISITGYNNEMILCDKHLLEAVGLLRTYKKEIDNQTYYIYVLYAPKSPKDFFDDDLFRGLLVKSIGEKETDKLKSRYHVNLIIPDDYKEITSSFVDVFHPDYNDPAFKQEINNAILGHNSGRIVLNFDYDKFFSSLSKKSTMSSKNFTKVDMKHISKIATLYNVDEDVMSSIIIGHYNPENAKHFDFEKIEKDVKECKTYKVFKNVENVKSKINGEGDIADEIRMIDNCSPVEYLQVLQNNTKPASADIKIVEDLSKNYGFSYGVINSIVKYCLERNDNILKRNYVEKVAASIARQKIITSIDALNYLYKVTSKNEKKSKPVSKSNNNTQKVEVSDQEMDDILNMIDSMKKGGK